MKSSSTLGERYLRQTTSIPLIFILLFSACTSVKPNISTPDSTMQSTQTALLPTATSTPQPTLTLSPTFESTETPYPTPTPAGFYTYPSAGFSLQLPTSWTIIRETDSQVVFSDQSTNLTFMAMSELRTDDEDLDLAVNEIINALSDESVVFTDTLPDQNWQGNFLAKQIQLNIEEPSGKFQWRLAYVTSDPYVYMFNFIAQGDQLDKRNRTIDMILSSIRLFPPELFGLDRGETLYQLGGEPDSRVLDPALTTSSAADYVGLLFSGLVKLNPKLQIEPDLAESWMVSSDGKIYEFKLRPEARFASGRSITAQDVKDNWERATDPETESSTAGTYLGDIQGVKEKLSGNAKEISGLTVLSKDVLRVELDAPKPYFLAKLTYPTTFIVDPERIDLSPDNWMYEESGSGPYKFQEIIPSQAVILVRNDQYWAPPAIRNLVFISAPGGAPLSLYETGELDILYLSPSDVVHVREPDDPLHAEWLSTTSLCTSFLEFDISQPPMDDRNVRLAFALATDKASLIERLTENTDLVAETFLPPGLPGYAGDHPVYAYNTAAAKQALAASSYADQFPEIKLTTSGITDAQRSDVTALVEMWKSALGIDISVEFLDPASFSHDVRQDHGQIVLSGWCADYPDPENFLDVLFHSQSLFNHTLFTDEQIDVWLEEARIELDPSSRVKLYQQVEQRLLENVIGVPLFHSVLDVVVKPRIEGFVLSPVYANFVPWLQIDNSRVAKQPQ